jgi:hypothetical protein
VMMNGMNKGWSLHRKGFPEAFMAFAEFAKTHDDALLYMHAEQWGPYAQGINLIDLAMTCGIPENQLKFCDQYAYRCGFISQEHLAITYSAADVLLAPSRGEGFCIPLIEAQACGTPVIVTDFSAQPELVGAGWKVSGQPEWEAAQTSWMVKADIRQIVDALEAAYAERDDATNRQCAIAKGREYDSDLVFETRWKKILTELAGDGVAPDLVREKIPGQNGVAVLIPALNRPQNVKPLVDSFNRTAGKQANLYFVCDEDDTAQIEAVKASGAQVLHASHGSTYAQKVNAGFEQTLEPWIFVAGDDVKFHTGWVDWARDLSDRFDVIGTNDAMPGTLGNRTVLNGSHADHFFIRRLYVDEYGASLDGPGVVAHEGYGHFYTDVEIIELAKARYTFSPCLSSIVEHLHPDVNPDVPKDETYILGWSQRGKDEALYRERKPLLEMQSSGLSKVRAA